jgi:hypothetical protein
MIQTVLAIKKANRKKNIKPTYYRWRKEYGGMQVSQANSRKIWSGKMPD